MHYTTHWCAETGSRRRKGSPVHLQLSPSANANYTISMTSSSLQFPQMYPQHPPQLPPPITCAECLENACMHDEHTSAACTFTHEAHDLLYAQHPPQLPPPITCAEFLACMMSTHLLPAYSPMKRVAFSMRSGAKHHQKEDL